MMVQILRTLQMSGYETFVGVADKEIAEEGMYHMCCLPILNRD